MISFYSYFYSRTSPKIIYTYFSLIDEMFILPRKIPHSPQRPPKSLGMVIERKRKETELDGIRFYGDNLNEIVFEKWFKCEKLDRDLVPILTEWNEKRDKPLPKKFREVKPFDWSSCIEFKAPMKLQCLSNNPLDDCKGDCFAHKNNSFSVALKETVVKCLQSGQHVLDNSDNSCDLFIWHHGSFAQFEYPNTNYMVNDDCLLLREKGSFVLTNEGHTLLIKMSL